jgi:hypothetical protein
MHSDYERITRDNIRRRGEEFDDIGRFLSEQLYSDRTHFVYELLQNAEDALERRLKNNSKVNFSCKVQFRLYGDRLEFSHFGQPFDTEDVRAISDILKGTKNEDLNQIGKFGIGFKSVYGFTTLPEIHSGDEHFRVERYIRPRACPSVHSLDGDKTLFIFPFVHDQVLPKEAFRLISEKLSRIGPRIVLFLNRISEIEWIVEGGEGGQYIKNVVPLAKCPNACKATVVGHRRNEDTQEEWLLFYRQLASPNTRSTVRVEIAFRLRRNNESLSVTRTKESPLVVFFPTEKDTRLGFLIQGSYRTTPSRDNIPHQDEWNRTLVQETAKLIGEVLGDVKNMGLLDVPFLEALPIRPQDFPEEGMFRPIFDAVRKTLSESSLLPKDKKGFVSARQAKLARSGELRQLLSPDRLQQLFASDQAVYWLSGEITADRTPDLRSYLIEQLKIEELTPEIFARKITTKFLEEQSDGWIAEFYGFLLGQEALWRRASSYQEGGPLLNKAIIRLEDGRHVQPFHGDGSPNAYLPPNETTKFPVVKRNIASGKRALEFLKKLGLPELDIVAEVVENILSKYERSDCVEISDREHQSDIAMILRSLKTDSQQRRNTLLQRLKATAFLRAKNCSTDTLSYKRPSELYEPTSQLKGFFAENPNAWFIDEPKGEGEWRELGVQKLPRRTAFGGYLSPGERRALRGKQDYTNEISTTDYRIDGLEHFLGVLGKVDSSELLKDKASLLWNILLAHLEAYSPYEKRSFFQGEYQWFYYTKKFNRFDALWIRLLRQSSWLPSRLDDLPHKPSELLYRELPEGFKEDELLVRALEMKSDDTAALAQKVGIEVDDIEFMKKHSDEFQQWKIKIGETFGRVAVFPVRISKSPERREEALVEGLAGASVKDFQNEKRSVRISRGSIDPDTYLRSLYTNDDGQMVCQICKQEMPFKKRDGQYYFEAVEALTKDHLPKEHEAQFLALCPLCAAMYKEFIKRDELSMADFRKSALNGNNLEILIKLGERVTSVRFVRIHFDDLRTILESQD